MSTTATRAPTAAEIIPAQARPYRTVSPGDWVLRQVQAVDAWNAARRLRESLLDGAGGSRLGREVASRHADVLRRTHAAIVSRTAGELAGPVGPMLFHTPTAVVAHRHAWFAEKVTGLLEAQGVTVVECTDNGADALGAIVAEQPDVVLVGERLEMMTGQTLLSETHVFAPCTLRTVQADNQRQAGDWERQLTRSLSCIIRRAMSRTGSLGSAVGSERRAGWSEPPAGPCDGPGDHQSSPSVRLRLGPVG